MNNNRNIRRLQMALYSRGEGVILFSLWSGIKMFLMLFSTNMLTGSAAYASGYGVSDHTEMYFIPYFVFLVLFFGGNLVLNIYIGRAVMGFSRGEQVRRAPLVWDGLYACFYGILLLGGLALSMKYSSFLVNLVTCVLDVFVVVIHVEIIIFSHRLKKAEA